MWLTALAVGVLIRAVVVYRQARRTAEAVARELVTGLDEGSVVLRREARP
jgi:hypothetical protein